MDTSQLKAPFPYFGGKSRIASLVWDRFGRVDNYVEGFFGSGAVLLGCPHPGHTETVNDADGLLANFWRALQTTPDEVARYADWPVNEADLHARHRWLVDHRSMVEELMEDPEWHDAKAAGWWVWGISQWIGTGWCPVPNTDWSHKDSTKDGKMWPKRPQLSDDRGVQRKKLAQKRPAIGGRGHPGGVGGVHGALHQKMPHAGDDGRGVHRARGYTKDGELWKARPNLGDGVNSQGNGIHSTRLSQQMPHLQGDSGATGKGINRELLQEVPGALYDYFRALATRLRRTRVACGDFERVLGPSVTWRHGLTAVFLDPPYADAEHAIKYAGGGNVWGRVTRWCEANGDNKLLRIALCGYEGTWIAPEGWHAVKWRTSGGYGSQGNGRGRANAEREMIWFSPNCQNGIEHLPLFAGLEMDE